MPTYEYRCPNGHAFERFYKMSDAVGELECPECGAVATRQLSGGAGLLFKGSGFYLTDYGRNAHRGGSGGASSASSGGTDKASDKSGTSDKSGGASDSASKGDAKGATPAPKPAGGDA